MEYYTSLGSGSNVLSTGSPFCLQLIIYCAFLFYLQRDKFSGPHFRLPRFDSPLTTPSEVKINGRRILPVINYYIENALFVKCLYPSLYPVV